MPVTPDAVPSAIALLQSGGSGPFDPAYFDPAFFDTATTDLTLTPDGSAPFDPAYFDSAFFDTGTGLSASLLTLATATAPGGLTLTGD